MPADGSYVLQIYDFLYKGGDEYFYRLTFSTAPYLDFIMPPVGPPRLKREIHAVRPQSAGRSGRECLHRRRQAAGPGRYRNRVARPTGNHRVLDFRCCTVRCVVAISERKPTRLVDPTEAAQDAFSYRLPPPLGPSINAVDIFYSPFPIVRSQKPNDTPAQAQKVQPPCEVVGQFNPRGDQDWYAFDAKKGDVFWIEVYSQRLGLPTDPYLLVQRSQRSRRQGDPVRRCRGR